jgi:hypothetical protein
VAENMRSMWLLGGRGVHVSRSEQMAGVERFLAALRTGQLLDLMEVIATDVVLIADGGGLVPAARTPIYGAERVPKLSRPRTA